MKYSILTYDFGRYDLPRKPKETKPEISYVFVTDKDVPPTPFKTKKLAVEDKNPLLNCQYVKHNPFEFVDTEWVVVMDSSIEICQDITPIVDFCEKKGIEALFVSNPYSKTWKDEMNVKLWNRRNPNVEIERKWLLENFKEFRLNIEGMFYVLKNTEMVRRLFESVRNKCEELKRMGTIPRPCQVLYSATVSNEFKNEVKSGRIAFMTSYQIRGAGTMMRIYDHGKNRPLYTMDCRTEIDILGEIVRPYEFREFDRRNKNAPSKVSQDDDDWED